MKYSTMPVHVFISSMLILLRRIFAIEIKGFNGWHENEFKMEWTNKIIGCVSD